MPENSRRRPRRRGVLNLLLLVAAIALLLVLLDQSGLSIPGLGWSEAQRKRIRALGVDGSPTLVVYTAEW